MSRGKKKKAVKAAPSPLLYVPFAAVLLLLFVPGIIIEEVPVSAFDLFRAEALHTFGAFPSSTPARLSMLVLPLMSAVGLIVDLFGRSESGRCACGASIALLLFGMTSVWIRRELSFAGGFEVWSIPALLGAAFLLHIGVYIAGKMKG